MKRLLIYALVIIGLINSPKVQGEGVKIASLDNGVLSYVEKNTSIPGYAALRVVFRTNLSDQILYRYDGEFDSCELAKDFFQSCCAFSSLDSKQEEENQFYSSPYFSPLFEQEFPQQVAVIAVGDFNEEKMQQLIEQTFSSLTLAAPIAFSEPAKKIHVQKDPNLFKVALNIHFACPLERSGKELDLNDYWQEQFLVDLFQNRLERCARIEDAGWLHPHPRFLSPVPGYALIAEDLSENMLCYLLWQAEAIRTDGFTEEEFYVAKRNLLMRLQYLTSQDQNCFPFSLAGYYVDQFLMNRKHHLNYTTFLKRSEALIEKLSLEDLEPRIDSFFQVENRSVHVIYPSHLEQAILTEETIQKLSDRIQELSANYQNYEEPKKEDWNIDIHANSLEKEKFFPKTQLINQSVSTEFCLANNLSIAQEKESIYAPFYGLPIHDKDKKLIASIVLTIANKNVFQLAFEKRGLEKKGKKVNGVHPLRFIGHIFSVPELKRAMRSVKKSSFKWDGFLDGFSKRMKLEHERNNLMPYVPGFAQYLNVNPDEVRHYIHKKDWAGLLIFLM